MATRTQGKTISEIIRDGRAIDAAVSRAVRRAVGKGKVAATPKKAVAKRAKKRRAA